MSTTQNPREENVRKELESFLDHLNEALDGDPQEIERAISGDRTLHKSDLGSTPEDWTEDALIDPLIKAVGLQKELGRPTPSFELPEWRNPKIPDFELKQIQNQDIWIIGENKSLNNYTSAREDIEEYLVISWWPNNGIATDGLDWTIYHVGNDKGTQDQRSFREDISLRDALLGIAKTKGLVGGDADQESINESIREFVDCLQPEGLVQTLKREAPQWLRQTREDEVEEFFELYIELLFGDSEEYNGEYDTCLRDDIIAPDNTPEQDKDIFAVTLVNRLLFIKFLEKNGVLQDGFLVERVEAYDEDLPNSLYKTVLEPLFYDLLNTPKPRPEPLQGGWKDNVHYLNGGLFRENVDNEQRYDVVTRTLPKLIEDLIERGKLDFELDPQILGSVFERTINHIGGDGAGNQQKSTGAYYTPEDVTQLISEQSVRPKIRDELVEAFSEAVENETEFRAEVEGMPLEEMLVKIEDGISYFGRTEGVNTALDQLQNLTVLDPACGSGHFLTTAYDELHLAQLSLLEAKHGESLDDQIRFKAKKELALNTIYGVDVEPVAVEIAKLRIWLKIVEEGWEEEFGRLPNIDMNITVGNSLIGYPITGSRNSTLNLPDIQDRVTEVLERRLQYRHDDQGNKDEIETLMKEEIRPAMDRAYVNSLNKTITTQVESTQRLEDVFEAIDEGPLHTRVSSVKVERADNEGLSDNQLERLSDMGFEYDEWRDTNKSAKLDIKQREQTADQEGQWSSIESIFQDLRSLLEDGFVFTEFQRQPLETDLDDILSRPFHWSVEFPELLLDDEVGENFDESEFSVDPTDIGFDIILGNPPYGKITSDAEDTLTYTYRMNGSDISALFVERQLHLLAQDGYFGNITTLGLVYQSSMSPLHDEIENTLSQPRISCFGLRGRQGIFQFDTAKIRVSIFTGQKQTNSDDVIETSDLIVFNDENRQERLENIEHNSTEGLVLRDRIGGSGSNGPILPKVGPDIKNSIIQELKSHQGRLFGDVYEKEDGEHTLYRPASVGYWVTPKLEKLFPLSSKWDKLNFDSEVERKLGFLLFHSSLYYLHYITYGNQRDHPWTITSGFPFPEEATVAENEERIIELADKTWKAMEGHFTQTGENRGRFDMPPLRPLIDVIDEFVGKLYGLSDEQIEYTQNYFADFEDGSCRTGLRNKTLADFDVNEFFEEE